MQDSLEYEAFQADQKRVVNEKQCTKNDQISETYDTDKILSRLKILVSKFEALQYNITFFKWRVRGHKSKHCPQNQAQANHPFNRYHNYRYRQQNYAKARPKYNQYNNGQKNSQ